MTETFVIPKLITWARAQNNLRADIAARTISVSTETFDIWERGDVRPTLRQAQELARKLRIPFGYLYLPTPPNERLPLPGLRTVADAPPSRPSPDFLEILYDALRK